MMEASRLILGINTSTLTSSVALVARGRVFHETSWRTNRNETSKLMPAIAAALKKSKRKFTDIGRIVAVSGPGPFSSIRIGVTVANTLALCLQKKVYSLPTAALLARRYAKTKADRILFHAGENVVALLDFKAAGASAAAAMPMATLIHILKKSHGNGILTFVGDLKASQRSEFKELAPKTWRLISARVARSFGEVIAGLPRAFFSQYGFVHPRYLRPPHITLPRHVY